MADDLKRAIEYLLTPSAPVFVVGGLLVLLVPLLVHFYVVRRTPYNTTLPTVLLVGPSGAGKTSLLTLLERGDGGPAPTRTSQVTQSVELTASADGGGVGSGTLSFREAAREDAPGSHKKFQLVDTPGHGKLRNHAAAAVSSSSSSQTLRGVVFVLDAAALDDALAATAAYLYDVLLALQRRAAATKTSRSAGAVNVLLAANKLDLFTALPASLVRANLEAELARVRISRSKGLLDSGVGIDDVGSEENDDWLGEYGSDKFSFSQMREFDVDVTVLGGSVLEGNVDKWWEWIAAQI